MYYTFWILYQAKTERKHSGLCQRFTDKLPTGYRHITNCRPTVDQLSTDCPPTVGRQVAYVSGKTCWPSVGRLSADSWPTVGRQTTDRRPTVGQQTADSRPTGFLGSSSSQLPTREATREPFLPSPQESHLVWEDQNYKIIETGAIIAGIYRKPTNTEQYLNFDSKYHLGDKRLYTLLSSQRRKT